MLCQSMQQMLRYLSTDQSDGLTNTGIPRETPVAWLKTHFHLKSGTCGLAFVIWGQLETHMMGFVHCGL